MDVLFRPTHPRTRQYLLGYEDMAMMWKYVKNAAQDVDELCRSPVDALSR
jgi:hypothetical protein